MGYTSTQLTENSVDMFQFPEPLVTAGGQRSQGMNCREIRFSSVHRLLANSSTFVTVDQLRVVADTQTASSTTWLGKPYILLFGF